jgi:hypothetical protein
MKQATKKAIEFLGEIDGGIIRLPKNYTSYTAKNVRVILLIEENEEIPQQKEDKKSLSVHSQKEELQLIFEKMKGKAMFSKIDNPTEWQKNIRNEWE